MFEAGVAHWFDFETLHDKRRPLAWRRADRSGMLPAIATGVFIAGYTSVDAAAVREDGGALSVIGAEFVLLALTLGLVVMAMRGRRAMLGMFRSDWRSAVLGGFATGTAYLLVMIAALKVFNTAWVATKGGPSYATWFFALHIYSEAFAYFRLGYGSALAWILALVLIVFTWIQVVYSRRWVHYEGG